MSNTEPLRRWLWLLAALFGLRLVLMAVLPMADTSEPRYAEIARLMAATGDWITPWFEPGVPFWGKPPLAFWASALSFRLFGYTDFAARLPAWLATLATAALIYSYARDRFGVLTARLATLIYSSCLLSFVLAGAVLTDAYLTLAVALSLVALGKQQETRRPLWGYAFFLGLALGMLSKGPLALVLIVAVIVLWLLAQRRTALLCVGRLPWLGGLLLFLVLSLPWYVLAEQKTPGFLRYFILGEHYYRFVDPGWHGDLYGSAHQRAYGSIWLDWVFATLPWGPYALWLLLSAALRKRLSWKQSLHTGTEHSFLLAWALVTPAFFTLSGNILWTYVLPSLPAFSILLAGYLARKNTAPSRISWPLLMAAAPAVGLLIGVAALINPTLLKTERGLIATQQAYARSDQPLYYVDSLPFSARYYSRDTARLLEGKITPAFLDSYPQGVFVAVDSDSVAQAGLPDNSPVLFKSRHYSLFFAKGRHSNTPPPAQGAARP
ncbi:ArnT family glycosyltransferase [Alcaligenes sp. SDU_A2]|uniref:ArnT family glycosyltransferase n=1 Tax=Alcaligenes sp. SDU_A2 TaxID=3136634 RepID=UPI00311EE012